MPVHPQPSVSLNQGVLERMSGFGSLQKRPQDKDVSARGYLGGDVRRHYGSAGSDEGEGIGKLAMRVTGLMPAAELWEMV